MIIGRKSVPTVTTFLKCPACNKNYEAFNHIQGNNKGRKEG